MAQLVCNANTWRTLALLVPSVFISHYVFESVFLFGAMLYRYTAGLETILGIF